MPIPSYIICSQDGSIDKATNAPSVFGIYESLKVQEVAVLKEPPADLEKHARENSLIARFTASWIKEDSDDSECEYESDLVVTFTPFAGEPQHILMVHFTKVYFKAAIHRLFVPKMLIPIVPSKGIIELRNRIRKMGEQEWLGTQSCKMVIEEVKTKESTGTIN